LNYGERVSAASAFYEWVD